MTGGSGQIADRHKTIRSPVRRVSPLSEDAGSAWRGLLRVPPLPEGAGFARGGAWVSAAARRRWFPSTRFVLVSAVVRRLRFPLAHHAGFLPCPKARFSACAGCPGSNRCPKTLVFPGAGCSGLHRSRRFGFLPRGACSFSHARRRGSRCMLGAHVSTIARRRWLLHTRAAVSTCIRRCWFLRPRLLLRDDVAAEASAPLALFAEAMRSGGLVQRPGLRPKSSPPLRPFVAPKRADRSWRTGPRSAIYPAEAE
jgi:hypothetical protein